MDTIFRLLQERWPGFLLEAVLMSCVGSAMLWAGLVRRPVVRGTALAVALVTIQLLLWALLDRAWASRWSLLAMVVWLVAIGMIIGGRRHIANYGAVDATIDTWAKRHSLRVSTEFGGVARRFCYVSAGEHECFQISIEPPENGTVTVNVWDVETENDDEFHTHWRVALHDLDRALEAALSKIADWSKRAPTRQ